MRLTIRQFDLFWDEIFGYAQLVLRADPSKLS